jgi:YVTN family beta-propeller protein
VNDPIPSAAERNHALPAAVDDVLRRALAKDRAKRPASCRVLIESTRSALGLGRPADRHGSPRLPIVTAAVAGVATAALLAAVWIGRGDAPRGAATANAGSIVRIDPATASVGARQTVATRPTAVAVGDDDAWAIQPASSTLVRLEAGADAVRSTSAHGVPSDVAVAGGYATVANGTDGTAAVFDSGSGAFQGVIQLGGFGFSDASVASDGRWAWVASGRRLKRIDLARLTRAGATPLPIPRDDEVGGDVFATDVAVEEGSVWVTGDVLNPVLWRIDPEGERRPEVIELPFGPVAVAAGEGAVWVANQLDDSVTRIDAGSGRVGSTLDVGREPVPLAARDGVVWVANRLDGTVSRIDARTNRVTTTVEIGEAVEDIGVGGGGVWVAVGRP